MADAEPLTEPVIVELPAEIDISNSGAVATQLRAAITPGARAVVADLSTTTFLDSSGVRVLVLARSWAAADGVELQLVASPGATLLVLELTGIDRLMLVYPTLTEALAAYSGARRSRRVPPPGAFGP